MSSTVRREADSERPHEDVWNDTATPYERDATIDEVVRARVLEAPDAVAVDGPDGMLTYRELDEASARIARALSPLVGRAIGAGHDPYVGVLAERSTEAVAAFLGVLRAGAGYVPLDPDLPKERLRYILGDTDACAVLLRQHLVARCSGLADRTLLTIEAAMATPLDDPDAVRAHHPTPPRPVYVMYTSGSTGRPKGVVIDHRGVLRYVRGAEGLLPDASDRVLLVNQLGFDASTYEIWAALTNGSRLVVHPPGRFDPFEVAETIARHEVTVAFFATGIFHQLVEAALPRLSTLRLVIVGGDVLSASRARRFVTAHPKCRLINAYGPTETTVSASFYEVSPEHSGPTVPIGRPLHNTTLYVLDEEGRRVADGERGELYIGGDGVARGYLNLPALTREKFVPDGFSGVPGSRLYRTGDQVRVAEDGELEFLGRLDDQVKIRGFRVEPAEAEMVLSAYPRLEQVVVVPREDVPGHKRLVAYVAGNADLDEAQLRRFAQSRLPDYLVPSAIVVLDELPLTTTGKVDRGALPAPGRPAGDSAGRAPATEAQRAMAAAWEAVLRVSDVTVDDDFFESGGDSLLALALLARVRAATGVALPIASVFEERSVGALARRLEEVAAEAGRTTTFAPIEQLAGAGAVPASISQSQVLFMSELAEGALPYQSQAIIWLEGALDVEALERALGALVARHEILRTAFPEEESRWMQRVHPPFAVRLPVTDLRGEGRSREFDAMVDATFRVRIDPAQVPSVRWTLLRVADELHALVQVEHHVVHDGATFATLLGELVDLYGAYVEGRHDPLAPPLVQYRDWARWQRAFPETPEGQVQLGYWAERLENLPAPLELPSDRPRPAWFTFRGGSLRAGVSDGLFDEIRAVAAGAGSTPYIVMAAAFFAFLHLYTGETDIVIGSGLANRRVPGSETLLGMLVNTVSLRTDLGEDPTVAELLARVRGTCLGAFAAQEIPFEEVVKRIAPERHGGPSPVYRHLFSFHDSPFPSLERAGLRVTPHDTMSNGSAKADVNVVVINRRGRAGRPGSRHAEFKEETVGAGDRDDVTIVWEYCTDLFDETAARRMLSHYLHVLSQIVRDPSLPLSAITLLTPEEESSLLAAAKNVRPYERDASIVTVFADRVREHPDSCAVTCGQAKLSYRELDERSEIVAQRLRATGVRRGVCVGVLDDRSPSMIVNLVGVLKAGGGYVGLDPSLPLARFDAFVERAGITTICASGSSSGSGVLERLDRSSITVVLADAPAPEPSGSASTGPGPASEIVGPDDLAYVSYTSGSTGEPKGVEVLHRGVVRLVRGADYVELGPRETLLAMAPLSFDASTFEIWGALLNGGRLVLAPKGPLSTREIADVIRSQRITTAWLTAAIFHQMVDYELESLTGIRQLVAGGDVLSPSHVNQALRVLPRDGVLVNGYGPTETTTFACCHRMSQGSQVDGPVPIGRPIANTSAYILDRRRVPVPAGVAGELFIGGDGVARGYLGRPDLTAERFVPDPFSSNDRARLYRTGDLARKRADGVIEFLGRADRQVKIRGFRVEPGEIEATLVRHPEINEAFVSVFEAGPGDKRLVAYLSGRRPPGPGAESGQAAGVGTSDEEVRRFLAGVLPPYMHPTAYLWLDEIPLTPGGKVDVARLPSLPSTWAPADGAADGLDTREPVVTGRNTLARAPGASRLEQRLITLWQEVLGVRPIGLRDNFFDLGGHSLLAVALFAEIERATGARLPLATIFESPTVEEMAIVLKEGGWDSAWGSLVPLTTTGTRPPIFCVTAGDGNTVGFGALARRLGPDQPFYALQPRGLDGRILLHRRVEGMAAHYVKQIRRVQPKGPYVLGGRCFGTLVAYEMARRLEADGDRVALLVALDSVGPQWKTRHLANGMAFDQVMNLCRLRATELGIDFGDVFTSGAAASQFVEYLRQPVGESGGNLISRYLHTAYLARADLQEAFPLGAGGYAGLVHWSWEGGVSEMGMNRALLPPLPSGARTPKPSVDPRHRPWHRRAAARLIDWVDVATRGRLASLTARRQHRLLEIATQTVLHYRGGPCAAPIALIRSEEYRGDPQLARWYGVETGGVEEHYVLGSHESMVREPDVASLAAAIEGCIDALGVGPREARAQAVGAS